MRHRERTAAAAVHAMPVPQAAPRQTATAPAVLGTAQQAVQRGPAAQPQSSRARTDKRAGRAAARTRRIRPGARAGRRQFACSGQVEPRGRDNKPGAAAPNEGKKGNEDAQRDDQGRKPKD